LLARSGMGSRGDGQSRQRSKEKSAHIEGCQMEIELALDASPRWTFMSPLYYIDP
jgi:hypothetical protein